jgi:hypothetical protein
MPTREAACHCGQLRLEVEGDPFSVSICNCLACQRRSGSAFGRQAGYDSRRHPWVRLPESINRYSPEVWDPVRSFYDAGRYAEAADRGRELIDAHPDQAYLYYNVACREILAGRTGDALGHLGRAIDVWEGCREMAKQDRTSTRSATIRRSRP